MQPKSIRVFRVPINQGGYDRSGEYWGIGMPLYCATDYAYDGDYKGYTRARSRDEAIENLGLPIECLIVKPRKD